MVNIVWWVQKDRLHSLFVIFRFGKSRTDELFSIEAILRTPSLEPCQLAPGQGSYVIDL